MHAACDKATVSLSPHTPDLDKIHIPSLTVHHGVLGHEISSYRAWWCESSWLLRLLWVIGLSSNLTEPIYPETLPRSWASMCMWLRVCVHVWQTERAWKYFRRQLQQDYTRAHTSTHTHTGQGEVPACSTCPAVMGLLSPTETLSHTLSWEIDSPEVPIPFVSVCVSLWERDG